jgi:hypothetical protein
VNRPQELYYFDTVFPHAATELPFAWWVKCVLLSGVAPRADAAVVCPAWDARLRVGDPAPPNTDLRAMLQRIDGHITAEWWAANVNAGAAVQGVCTASPSSKLLENEETLKAQFEVAKALLQQRPAVGASLDETCFRERVFERTVLNTKGWEAALNGFYTQGTPVGDEFLVSAVPLAVDHKARSLSLFALPAFLLRADAARRCTPTACGRRSASTGSARRGSPRARSTRPRAAPTA